jgi:hypothetical protein
MSVDIIRIVDLYKEDKKEMEAELAENIKRFTIEYQKNVSPEKKAKMYITSELNIKWDGAKDLTGLSQEEKRSHIERGPIYHDAYCALSKRKDFNRGEDKIVVFTTPIPNAIAIGTTKSSVTKYWTGFGVVDTRGDSYLTKILSPKNLNDLDRQRFELVNHPVDNIDLSNLRDIRLYSSSV